MPQTETQFPELVHARLPEWLANTVRRRATRQGRSVSGQVRYDLRRLYVDEVEERRKTDQPVAAA